jgi:putative transposase
MNEVTMIPIIATAPILRGFTLKGIGEVGVKVPRDRKSEFKTEVLPRSKQYEDAIREDMSVMFLAGVSTRTLSLISERLIGRRISASEVSKASRPAHGGR